MSKDQSTYHEISPNEAASLPQSPHFARQAGACAGHAAAASGTVLGIAMPSLGTHPPPFSTTLLLMSLRSHEGSRARDIHVIRHQDATGHCSNPRTRFCSVSGRDKYKHEHVHLCREVQQCMDAEWTPNCRISLIHSLLLSPSKALVLDRDPYCAPCGTYTPHITDPFNNRSQALQCPTTFLCCTNYHEPASHSSSAKDHYIRYVAYFLFNPTLTTLSPHHRVLVGVCTLSQLYTNGFSLLNTLHAPVTRRVALHETRRSPDHRFPDIPRSSSSSTITTCEQCSSPASCRTAVFTVSTTSWRTFACRVSVRETSEQRLNRNLL